MNRRRSPVTTFLLMSALFVASPPAPAVAQADGKPAGLEERVRNDRPKFLVRAWVDRKHGIYAEGETLTLKVRCEEDAYLYVIYQQADGKLFQIFPNSGQPDNRIKAMQDVQVPSADDGFRWIVGAPLGKEVVKVIASKQPIDALSLPGLRTDHLNPVTLDQVAGAWTQVANRPGNVCSEHDLKITTVKKGDPTEPAEPGRRYGVFFGVSEYEFNDLKAAASTSKKGPNVSQPATDAEDMAALLKRDGRLDDVRVYRNAEATRDQMRTAITEWLYGVSKRGDTVFIFFSGHGTQIPDDGHDEADKLDEVLLTADFIDFPIFMQMDKVLGMGDPMPPWRDRYARLAPEVSRRLDEAKAALNGMAEGPAKDEADRKFAEEISGYLLRQTAVDDDEMGHWIQKLDGRKVVVVVMACHSGGLTPTVASPVKGLDPPPKAGPPKFDFLKSMFGRLKDLDQPSLTVMTAAAESESAIGIPGQRNSFYTQYLKEAIEANDAPLDVRKAHELCKAAMAAKFKLIDEARLKLKLDAIAHVPQLFTTDTQPVYLKPAPHSTDADSTNPED